MPPRLSSVPVEPKPYEPQFTGPIFMGAGDATRAECARAHNLLDTILDMIGGLQQPIMATEVHDEDDITAMREEQCAELAIMIADLNRAMGI